MVFSGGTVPLYLRDRSGSVVIWLRKNHRSIWIAPLFSLKLIILSLSNGFGQPVLSLRDGIDRLGTANYCSYVLTDPQVSFEEVYAFPESAWKPMTGETSFGYTAASVWVRLRIQNESHTNRDWLMDVAYPPLDSTSLFVPDLLGSYSWKNAGAQMSMTERSVDNRRLLYRLRIPTGEQREYYLRVVTASSALVPINIWHPAAFDAFDNRMQLILGLFFGILVAMIIYNLSLYASNSDPGLLYYSMHVLGYAWYQATFLGFSNVYLWREPTWLGANIIPLLGAWIMLSGSLLTRELLLTRKNMPRLDMGLLACCILGALLMAATAFVPRDFMVQFISFPVLLFSLYALVVAVFSLRTGYRPAKYFFFAISSLYAPLAVRILRNHGILPDGFVTTYALNIGNVAEAVLLSLGFGVKISLMKEEHEKEKAAMRNRIASDLHDEIGSNLSTIVLFSRMISKARRLSARQRDHLALISNTASEAVESMRDIVWFIDPGHDTSETLVFKMKSAAVKLLDGVDFKFESNIDGHLDRLTLEFKRNLFLVYKEALHNTAKHARATSVRARLTIEDGNLLLSIEDNGVGFDEGVVEKGQGLRNIRTRAAQIGATLKIESSPGSGTKVQLQVKIP